ncbi:MAG: NUDIX hydrolase [Myxococcota bacterium]
MTNAPVQTRLAATILLLRDGRDGLEVFMLQRHHQIDFAKGAMVFPGGRLDPEDGNPAVTARCRGVEGLSASEIGLRVAGIRETFEECGVLLAHRRGSDDLIDADGVGALEERYRADLQAGELSIVQLVESEDLELACDRLVLFAHWITPEMMPKRFDTHFFLAQAPADQLALHDGHESVDSVWTTPAAAAAEAEAGRRTIIFPTLMNLRKLGRSQRAADAIRAARADRIVTVLPRVQPGDDGQPVLHIPAEAGYDVVNAPVDGLR